MTINETLKCLDADRLSSDKIEDRVFQFVHDELNEAEQEDFRVHLSQCEYCNRRFMEYQELVDGIKENLTFDELCNAYSNKDWQEVIKSAGMLEILRYSEEVYPIKSKVNDARLMLGQ